MRESDCQYRRQGGRAFSSENARPLWPVLGQDQLLNEAGSGAESVAALFAGSPALGTLVVEAGRRKFRLPARGGGLNAF
jgi:hypothetical protein